MSITDVIAVADAAVAMDVARINTIIVARRTKPPQAIAFVTIGELPAPLTLCVIGALHLSRGTIRRRFFK